MIEDNSTTDTIDTGGAIVADSTPGECQSGPLFAVDTAPPISGSIVAHCTLDQRERAVDLREATASIIRRVAPDYDAREQPSRNDDRHRIEAEERAGLRMRAASADLGPFASVEQAMLAEAVPDASRNVAFGRYSVVGGVLNAAGGLAAILATPDSTAWFFGLYGALGVATAILPLLMSADVETRHAGVATGLR